MITLLNIMQNQGTFFTNMKNFALVTTFFSLWFAVYFQNQIEDIFAYSLILSLGILHGANDIKLIQKTLKPFQNIQISKILFSYVIIILLGILFFYYFSMIALWIFILFSAYHFGEQHWSGKIIKKNMLSKTLYLFYGLIILSILFYNNPVEVSIIIEEITNLKITKDFYFYGLVLSITISLFVIIILYKNKRIRTHLLEEAVYLLIFFIVFYTASLLWAFAIYFIFWHSIPSLADQVYFLYGNYKKENFYNYIKSSFLYWLVSIIVLFVLYWIFQDEDKLFLSIFFTIIAAITFPHVFIITKFTK